jgi:hypothetical protein
MVLPIAQVSGPDLDCDEDWNVPELLRLTTSCLYVMDTVQGGSQLRSWNLLDHAEDGTLAIYPTKMMRIPQSR